MPPSWEEARFADWPKAANWSSPRASRENPPRFTLLRGAVVLFARVRAARCPSRGRSPAYPAISLPRALKLAAALWRAGKRQLALVTRAAGHLGFSVNSGSAKVSVSAMKKYGLIEDEGSRASRKMRISEQGIALLKPSNPGRPRLLGEAALKPATHTELWERFGGGGSDG